MSSLPLVDPEVRPLLDLFPPMAFSQDGFLEQRAVLHATFAEAPVPDIPGVLREELTAPGTPLVRVLAYRPANATAPLPALLHIHGGGYVIGTADMMAAANMALAGALNCAVFSVDYRLAPETPAPGSVEDCYTALRFLHENAVALNLDTTRIGIKGESAGGGLAAALALLARDRGAYPIAFQQLIYPMLDDRTAALADPHPYTGEFIWTHGSNHFGWAALLGTAPGSEGVSPYAAPARATDLAGLPPCFIATGALDLFLEEDLDYARRLARAGVPMELHVYPGAMHGFDMMESARVTIQARRDIMGALQRWLHG